MNEGRRSRLAAIVVVVALLTLPVLYVLSWGPIGALIANGYISSDSTLLHALQVIYVPLVLCA